MTSTKGPTSASTTLPTEAESKLDHLYTEVVPDQQEIADFVSTLLITCNSMDMVSGLEEFVTRIQCETAPRSIFHSLRVLEFSIPRDLEWPSRAPDSIARVRESCERAITASLGCRDRGVVLFNSLLPACDPSPPPFGRLFDLVHLILLNAKSLEQLTIRWDFDLTVTEHRDQRIGNLNEILPAVYEAPNAENTMSPFSPLENLRWVAAHSLPPPHWMPYLSTPNLRVLLLSHQGIVPSEQLFRMADPFPQHWSIPCERSRASGVHLRKPSNVHAIFIEQSALHIDHAAALAAQLTGPAIIVNDLSTSLCHGYPGYNWFCIHITTATREPGGWFIKTLEWTDPRAADQYDYIKQHWVNLMTEHRSSEYSYHVTQQIAKSLKYVHVGVTPCSW